ncbi:protein pigeon-like isoform X2 [Watersipora subatra]|uniref:protein pigeon-like isoform X2 n=1 Tax=Watersipora subatra TaxID=2589382 RepID=UPI00355B8669
MLQFNEIVNLREEVCKGIQCEEWFRASGDELVFESVKLVGRENDGTFLFRYNTTTLPTGGGLNLQTHIGLCHLAENRVKTLLSLEAGKEEDVVHCTINETSTVIVFCIASDGPIKTRSSANKDMRLYLADVHAGMRRKTVPIEIVAERLENTKSAQFIHGTALDRKARLIVFEHTEYIGVLTLPLDSTGRLKDKEKSYKPDWIIGKHYWYQWDVDKQHLYTIAQDLNNDSIVLNVYQTSDKVTLQHLFLLPIEIDSKTTRPRLSRLNVEQRSQDRNIIVLTSSDSTNDGLLCLCNQVPYTRRDKSEVDLPFTLSYEILSFVHGKKFKVSVPNVPGRLRKVCIHFTLIGNFLLAYLPEVFTHILNVQDVAELGVLNIISGGESHSRVADGRGVLSRLNLPNIRGKHTGVFMYDSDCMSLYNVSISELALQDKFSEKWPSQPRELPVFCTPAELTNQLAILQHLLQTTTDIQRTPQLLESLKNDIANSDTAEVLSEYLIGSAFAVACKKPEITKIFCRLLPFTCTPTERSHKVPTGSGGKEGAVSIHIEDWPLKMLLSNDTSIGKECDFFVFLNLVQTKRAIKRFNVANVTRKLAEKHVPISRERASSSLKDKLFSLVRKESVRRESPPSSPDARKMSIHSITECLPDSLLNEDVNEQVVSGLADALFEYLKDCYPSYYSKAYSTRAGRPSLPFIVDVKKQQREFEVMCRSYSRILVNQVKVLLYHLYNILELKELYNKHNHEDLHKALLMFERYQLAVEDLGLPLPSEFPTLLTTLAYQSLHPVEFMQYVNNGMVELTEDFLEVLAVDKTPSKAIVKCECLARMPKEQAVHWSHKLTDSPLVGGTATRLVADDIFARYCSSTTPRPRTRSKGPQALRTLPSTSSLAGSEISEEDFETELPDSYNYSVKKLMAAGWIPGTNGVTLSMLERAVFYHTTEEDVSQIYLGS